MPLGKKVRVLLTARDVIHAWWVPDFGMKKDAIPGFINELWFSRPRRPASTAASAPSSAAATMASCPIVVEVKSPADFDAWLASQKAAMQASNAPAAKVAQAAPNTDEQTALRVADAE